MNRALFVGWSLCACWGAIARQPERDPVPEMVRVLVESYVAGGNFASAYFMTWQLARKSGGRLEAPARLALYEEAIGYWRTCDTDAGSRTHAHYDNATQLFCEYETRLSELGRYGSGYIAYAHATRAVAERWGTDTPALPALLADPGEGALVHLNYLMDRAVYEERAGRPRAAEQALRFGLEIAQAGAKGGNRAALHGECIGRLRNNLGVLLGRMGRSPEAEELYGQADDSGGSGAYVKLNRLRRESARRGVTDEDLARAAKLAEEMETASGKSPALRARRLYASMLLDAGRVDEAEHAFGDIIEKSSADWFTHARAEAFKWRGVLRSRHARPGAIEDLEQALAYFRSEGLRLDEAMLYVNFADYLLAQGRLDAAYAALTDSHRMVQAMDLPWLMVGTLVAQAEVLARLGRCMEAEQTWLDAMRLLADTPGIAPAKAYGYRLRRAAVLDQVGRGAEGDALRADAERLAVADGLTSYERELRDEPGDASARALPAVAAVAAPVPPPDLQPHYVSTRTAGGEEARAFVWLNNPARVEQRLALLASASDGTGFVLDQPPAPVVVSASPGETSLQVRVPAGGSLALAVRNTQPTDEVQRLVLSIGASTSRWEVVANARESGVATTLHASLAGWSPFWGVTAYHEVRPPAPGARAEFRVRASAAARIEIFDAATSALLAVDGDGNGSFADPGDLLACDATLDGFPDTDAPLALFLRIYPVAGASYADDRIDVMLETQVGMAWTVIGTDRILDFGE